VIRPRGGALRPTRRLANRRAPAHPRGSLHERVVAVEVHRALGDRAGTDALVAQTQALVSLGSTLRRRGRRIESRDPLREGYELARQCGAQGLAEMTRSELRASGLRLRP
jgi:hypothetical protein